MIATDSSSSAASRSSEIFRLDATRRLPSLPTAFLAGHDLDLLAPIDLWSQASLPQEAPSGDLMVERGLVAHALGDANAGYGHPRAEQLAAKLAQPETRVVVTGQQPGLLGGPLMALSKTMAALRYVAELEAAGIPAVAVFWVATEDHDWAEIARTTLMGRSDPVDLSLGEDREPLRPVGHRLLGNGMEEVAASARELLYGEEAVARLERVLAIYRSDTEVGDAFIRLMIEILGERAPLYLDSQLPSIKKLEAPILRVLIEKRDELDRAYSAAESAVEARGHALQVTPQPGVSPLFLLHEGERRRIEWRGAERFGLRGVEDFEADVTELLAILDLEPERISPGVLARPAVQDALLTTTLQILGPAELSYMTQAKAAHALLGLRGVHTTLRPQTLFLEGKHAEWLEELDLPLEELFDRPLDEALAERKSRDVVTPVRQNIDAEFEILRTAVLELDKSLESPLEKTREQIARGLDMLSSKIAAAVARQHDVWRRRLEQMKATLQPGGVLQERRLATAFLWGRHGDALLDALEEQLDLDPRRLSVIRLD